MSLKAFIAAHTVLKVLSEHGAKPAITMMESGLCTLILIPEDYAKYKELAEQLLKTNKWFPDSYGNFNLFSATGLIEEDE